MQIKILSWNIWYDGHFNEISKFLESSNADIIGLQEVVPDDTTRDIIGFLKKLGYQCIFAPVLTIKKSGKTMSNAIFSKYPIVNNETYILSETNSRNALRADIKIRETTLHVFCTHLLHTHQQPSETQELQAENLVKILPKENTVVMGDFNATPESNAVKIMNKTLKNTDLNLTPTWSMYPEGCNVCNPKKVGTRLDYIFTSNDIKTNSPRVYQSGGSDHLPISVIMEII